jgi:hypothetical protein
MDCRVKPGNDVPIALALGGAMREAKAVLG